mgnify:CR=1 FL=1
MTFAKTGGNSHGKQNRLFSRYAFTHYHFINRSSPRAKADEAAVVEVAVEAALQEAANLQAPELVAAVEAADQVSVAGAAKVLVVAVPVEAATEVAVKEEAAVSLEVVAARVVALTLKVLSRSDTKLPTFSGHLPHKVLHYLVVHQQRRSLCTGQNTLTLLFSSSFIIPLFIIHLSSAFLFINDYK